jgi:hypothetical protein
MLILQQPTTLLQRNTRRLWFAEWVMVALFLALALGLRLLLIHANWPITNSDEANMGLVALHVAYQGDHPLFFYGQLYMGPVEGYIAAVLFRLMGPSLFTLRLAVFPLVIGFLLSSYCLMRLLYSRTFALASLLLFTFGSGDVLFLELRAVGEYPGLLMFSPLILLLAAWLALTYRPGEELGGSRLWRRYAVYALLGLSSGLALWIDFLIGPFVLLAMLLLLLFCRRELWGRCGLSLLVGLIIGAEPLLYYNLTAPLSQNSLAVMLAVQHGGADELAAYHLSWLHQLSGALFIALPWATGYSPRCSLNAIPPWGLPTLADLPCVLFQMGWGLGYLALGTLAVLLCWQRLRPFKGSRLASIGRLTDLKDEERRQAVRLCTQLAILAAVGLTLVLYVLAPAAAVSPDTTFRYLTCALVALPILLWPLWSGVGRTMRVLSKRQDLLRVSAPGRSWQTATSLGMAVLLLLVVIVTFVSGTIRTFGTIPAAESDYQRRLTLIEHLERIGATRVYSEYWTCNWLAFLSRETIICSVLDAHLRPGHNRYTPYQAIVAASPAPAYVFPIAAGLLDATTGQAQARAFQEQILARGAAYRSYLFVGYLVYQPVAPRPGSSPVSGAHPPDR